MMSTPTCMKRSGSRMCSMLASDPVSRLSTQITRLPRASSSSQRWEPRKPAPPVTRQVAIAAKLNYSRDYPLRTVATAEEHPTVAPIVGPDDPRRFTDSGIEVAELYSESDLPDG